MLHFWMIVYTYFLKVFAVFANFYLPSWYSVWCADLAVIVGHREDSVDRNFDDLAGVQTHVALLNR